MIRVYCKTTGKAQQSYYLTNGSKNIYLFVSTYRKSNKAYFGKGCTVNEVFSAKNHCSASVRMVALRIIAALKYAEKEYDMCIFDQTAKSKSIKTKIKNEQNKRICRGKFDLNDYMLEEVA